MTFDLPICLGCEGDVFFRFGLVTKDAQRLQIAFAMFPSICQSSYVIALPFPVEAKPAKAFLASPVCLEHHSQKNAVRDRRVGRLADPFRD